jgi:hypothetical protein
MAVTRPMPEEAPVMRATRGWEVVVDIAGEMGGKVGFGARYGEL